jgi:energy-coupling factor transporter ATP-binding protein EcfA2
VSIVFTNATFTYLHTSKPAVADINLEIEEGTFTAVLGRVGAGKSTLLRMMNSLVPNHIPGSLNGKVSVDGIDTQSVDVPQLAQLVNLVFDDPSLQIVSLTVEDDVIFGPANLGLPRDEIRNRVAEAIKRMRLVGYEARDPHKLSGGEQQLLAMAGILAMRPKYLVLDEPLAMLDPVGKKQVLEAIRELHEQFGLTVVIAESGTDIEAVIEFVDRAIVLDKGRICLDGAPNEVLNDQATVNRVGLRVPQITEVAYRLGRQSKQTVPVTLREGIKFVHTDVGSSEHSVKALSSSSSIAQPEAENAHLGEKAIVVRNLWHRFPGPPAVEALRGINLEVEKGEMLSLLGQNGTGKTTLAFHLVGALKPTNKDAVVQVAGLDVTRVPQFEIIQHANYVFQNPANQLFCDTFASEVSYGPSRLGLPPSEVEKRAKKALALVGLERLWQHSTFDIPKSQETLLGLASVLSLQPEVLVIDEPTGGLDMHTGRVVMETLEALNERGCTILIITHDMALAARYTKRIVVMHQGRVLLDGPARDVFAQPEILAQTMLQPPQITALSQALSVLGYPPNILTVDEFVEMNKLVSTMSSSEGV